MATHPDYPGVSSYRDRHGVTRWRWRSGGRAVSLPGAPGEAAFDSTYHSAVRGKAPDAAAKASIVSGIVPRSMEAAWRLYRKSEEWIILSPASKSKNGTLAEEFLLSPVAEGSSILWKQVPVADLKRRHLKAILAERADTPHKAKHMLTAIRKMIIAAMDEDWIEHDPSARIKWRPAYKGWRAWAPGELAQFIERWPSGTTPHLVFVTALWLGNRRSDVAHLRWDQRGARKLSIRGEIRIVRGFEVHQVKTGKRLFLPESPMLTRALDLAPRTGEHVVMTQYGKPFSEKSLTGRFAAWRRAADLPDGLTLHGLRKTLGKLLAEGGATTRQLMNVLGHDDMDHAELYSREAEQAILAVEGMEKVVALYGDGDP